MDVNQLLMIQLLGSWFGHGNQMDSLLLPEINFPGFKPLQLEAGPALQGCHVVEVMGLTVYSL